MAIGSTAFAMNRKTGEVGVVVSVVYNFDNGMTCVTFISLDDKIAGVAVPTDKFAVMSEQDQQDYFNTLDGSKFKIEDATDDQASAWLERIRKLEIFGETDVSSDVADAIANAFRKGQS